MEKDKTGIYIVAIVGIVAAVGIFVAIFNAGYSEGDISGAAVFGEQEESTIATTYNSWSTCLDQGNSIKLGNREGDTLVKKDVCTGKSIKQIATVYCSKEVDGFSYKYSEATNCPVGKSCMTDTNGIGYCE